MSVHGVGAAAAHRPQLAQGLQRGNRPTPAQPSTEGDGTTSAAPASGHQPPAHGVRRLINEGHFDGKNSYGPLTAKFGAPTTPLAETDPIAATALETIQEATTADPLLNQEDTPIIFERQPDILPPAPPPPTNQQLLDIDALLMEELINDSSTVGQFVEQLAEPSENSQPVDPLAA